MTNRFLDRVLSNAAQLGPATFCEFVKKDGADTISWSDLVSQSHAYAELYRNNGASKGDIIFIVLPHVFDLYPSFLGAMLIGAVPSFLPTLSSKQDPGLYWGSQEMVFRRTRARLIVTTPDRRADMESVVDQGISKVITIDQISISGSGTGQTALPQSEETALLQHSSGTTGLKKGVQLSYAAIADQLEAYGKAIGLSRPGDGVIASWLPLYHDMGLISCFLLPVFAGLKLVSIDAFEWTAKPFILLEHIERQSATHAWLPNFAFRHIVRATPRTKHYDLSSMRVFISCSEPCKAETFDQFQSRFEGNGLRATALQTCYAMAETVFALTQSDLERTPRRLSADRDALYGERLFRPSSDTDAQLLLSCGQEIQGAAIQVWQNGREVADGHVGAIMTRASFMFSGYFRDETATAAAFEDGWYNTGDLGFVWDGDVYITGRTKDVIIVNGRNFYAHDIEAAVSDVPGVKPGRAVAFGVFSEQSASEQIVIIAEKGSELVNAPQAIAQVTEAVSRTFGASVGDVLLVEAGWLVKTTSGKISRKENIKKYAELTGS